MNPQIIQDRIFKDLEQQLASGTLSQTEYNEAVRDAEREYAEAARESAGEAYERELGRW